MLFNAIFILVNAGKVNSLDHDFMNERGSMNPNIKSNFIILIVLGAKKGKDSENMIINDLSQEQTLKQNDEAQLENIKKFFEGIEKGKVFINIIYEN